MDFGVIERNWNFLLVQGLVGLGNFAGGTLRLAVPALLLGFTLGLFVGLGRLAKSRWIRTPATIYVELFRGVPLVMVIFWFWFILPRALGVALPEYGIALAAFVVFEAAYLGEIVRALGVALPEYGIALAAFVVFEAAYLGEI